MLALAPHHLQPAGIGGIERGVLAARVQCRPARTGMRVETIRRFVPILLLNGGKCLVHRPRLAGLTGTKDRDEPLRRLR